MIIQSAIKGRTKLMKKYTKMIAVSVAGVLAAGTAIAENWDMPMAYSASNFHSEMGVIFADKVRDYTGGDINITVHPGGSLFKGGEIKRAVQTGQAPIGERFMSAHANEAPLLGWDNLPFLATTYEANDKLWAAAKDKVNSQLSDLNLVALYTCPWPGQGFYFKKAVNSSADTQGIKFRSYNSATATFAEELGMVPVQVEAAECGSKIRLGHPFTTPSIKGQFNLDCPFATVSISPCEFILVADPLRVKSKSPTPLDGSTENNLLP